MRLFDAYVFVDWSARNSPSPPKPSENAIWVGHVTRGQMPQEKYCRTRHEAASYVRSLILRHVKDHSRVLVGFDFNYGYPSGFARAIGLPPGSGWQEIWTDLTDRIQDSPDNKNNRFAVAAELNRLAGNGREAPFWGCPAGTTFPDLQRKSPGFPFPTARGVALNRLRIVERRIPGVQEAWKLFGAGSVGSQTLVGIPRVCRLRRDSDFASVSRVWPFETGFNENPTPDKGPFVLHVEIWPGLIELVLADPSVIRDQAQLHMLCDWAAQEDSQGTFGRFFARPAGLTDEEVEICVQEEGWVLGAL